MSMHIEAGGELMALLAPFDRPLAAELLSVTRRPLCRSMLVPPRANPAVQCTVPAARVADVETSRFLVHTLLGDGKAAEMVLDQLEVAVDEHVATWSPSFYATSRAELVAALLDGDDSIVDVSVTIVGVAVADPSIYVEWILAGRFNNPGFLDDDVLIEPNGRKIETAGVTAFTFEDGRVVRICCFYDGFTVLEQLLADQFRPNPQ